MKRILTLLLVSAMLLVCASCGQISISKKEDPEDQTTEERNSADAAEEKEEDYEVQTEEKKKPSGKSESEYVAEKIEEAESVFKSYTDYQEALSVIRKALQKYPDNESLLEKSDYYQSFAPVDLYNLKPYKSSHGYSHMKEASDNFGNEYVNCVVKSHYNSKTEAIYDVKYLYNQFTATVFMRSDHKAENVGAVKIYGDNSLLYSKTNIDVYGRPFDIKVDVTGIQDLKIVFESSSAAEVWGMTNCMLQRTEK